MHCLQSTHPPPPSPTLAAPQGYMYGLLSALLSAVAAVYTEWVLKKNADTLYWQNMLLYGFGALANLLNMAPMAGDAYDAAALAPHLDADGKLRVSAVVRALG